MASYFITAAAGTEIKTCFILSVESLKPFRRISATASGRLPGLSAQGIVFTARQSGRQVVNVLYDFCCQLRDRHFRKIQIGHLFFQFTLSADFLPLSSSCLVTSRALYRSLKRNIPTTPSSPNPPSLQY